jgi:transcriptional regulator with XRE-family HTH domain
MKLMDRKNKSKATIEDQRVGKLIHFYREMRGITYRELAEYLNISIQQLQKYENGINRISTGTLQKIVNKLQIPLDQIFKHDDNDYVVKFEQTPVFKTAISLSKSFFHIKDEEVRQSIINLVQTLAKNNTETH